MLNPLCLWLKHMYASFILVGIAIICLKLRSNAVLLFITSPRSIGNLRCLVIRKLRCRTFCIKIMLSCFSLTRSCIGLNVYQNNKISRFLNDWSCNHGDNCWQHHFHVQDVGGETTGMMLILVTSLQKSFCKRVIRRITSVNFLGDWKRFALTLPCHPGFWE